MAKSLIKKIVADSKQVEERKAQFDEIFCRFIERDLNDSTREIWKVLIILMLENPFKYSHEIKQTIHKFKKPDDIRWIEEFVPQHYRK